MFVISPRQLINLHHFEITFMRIMMNVAKDINLSVDDIMIPIGIIHFNALCFIYYL